MRERDYIIGLDLGGTSIRGGAVDSEGKISARVKRSSLARDGYTAVTRNIRSVITQIIEKKRHEPTAIGLASAGAVDTKKMIITRSPNFPDWENVPLAKDIGAGFDFPVVLENDANSAALGEGWRGAAKGWSDYVMFTLGTGVGGGVVLGGELWRGPSGMAGEVGHITVHPGGRLCACGNSGCLETTASATGVGRTARERINEKGALWLLKSARGDMSRIGARLVEKGARDDDRLCHDILKQAGADLGSAMATITVMLGVTRFLIGGGMAPAFEFMKASARKQALAMAYTLTPRKLRIKMALLGDNAGIIGSARAVMSQTRD